ncbi:antibiotic biosynthesis monooxygenase [Geodermatophilus sabuli]|uniref:Antibiotic biosynthesis monooxygenase n=1 Tax=Geodermatophilus sabuli TaxID=1564158 RepID=A0A285EE19_9ACTN|nr:antibiotic biosynthesis monooxygenase [Geodermatophilus sabuli]MBB3086393.1 quinol monooxygenase YgiN [Geodermatophilus sabuli]SNX97392.1 Antibiotic biosynthesis monooxygenase [Geodermatophilus sabuli]
MSRQRCAGLFVVIIVAGTLTVRPDDRDAYVEGCRIVVEQARAAAGCLDFAITADPLEPGRIRVFERWGTRAELEAFRGSGPAAEQAAVLLAVDVAEYDAVRTHEGTPLPLPASIGAPASSALLGRGIRDLRDLTQVTERELRSWHGVGPKATSRLRDALAEHDLAFAPTQP